MEQKRKAPKLNPNLILGTARIQRPTLAEQILMNDKKVRQCVVSVRPERTQTLKARKERKVTSPLPHWKNDKLWQTF